MPFLTVHMPQETPQYGPTGEVSRPNWTVAPGEFLAAPLGAKKAGHACLADLAGVTPYGGGANTSSVPSILIAVVTGAIAWKARAWLTLVQIAITLAARTASPSAPVATSGPRDRICLAPCPRDLGAVSGQPWLSSADRADD